MAGDSVTIDLDLRAGDAEAEILGVAGALHTLDRATNGDFDLDFDNLSESISEVTGEIGELMAELEELEEIDPFKNFERKISRLEDLQDGEFDVNINAPGGDTGEGDSTGSDPPNQTFQIASGAERAAKSVTDGGEGGSSLNRHELVQNIERHFGFDRGSVKVSDSVDRQRLNELAADIENTTRGLTSDKYPWISGAGTADNLGAAGLSDEFHGGDFDSMPWNELQRKASQAGVYDQNDSRADLIRKLERDTFQDSSPFSVHTDEGKISLRDAIRNKQAAGADSGARRKFAPDVREMLAEYKAMQEQLEADIEASKGGFDLDKSGIETDHMKMNIDAKQAAGMSYNDVRRNDAIYGHPMDNRDDGVPDGDGSYADRIGDNDSLFNRMNKIRDKSDAMEALNIETDKFDKAMRKLRPTMGKYMQLLAAMIPIAVALGTQLLGVAAAMGAVGAAGGALIGIGLLGQGDSMESSLAAAKQQMQELKREMFQEVQPLAQQFAPISSRAFDAIPGALDGVFEEMEGLTDFEGTLFNLGASLAGGIEEFFAIINRNDDAIKQLTTRFAGIIGSGLLQFFEWLIQSASKNQDLLVSLGRDMMTLLAAFFNVSMAISQVVSAFSPWFKILLLITELMRNDFIVTLIQLIGWMYALVKVTLLIQSLKAGFMVLAKGIKVAVGMMTTYTLSTWQAVAATAALVGLLSGGLALLGGAVGLGKVDSMKPSGVGGGGGAGNVYNDNRNITINQGGNSDYAEQKRIENVIADSSADSAAMAVPEVESESTESDLNL